MADAAQGSKSSLYSAVQFGDEEVFPLKGSKNDVENGKKKLDQKCCGWGGWTVSGVVVGVIALGTGLAIYFGSRGGGGGGDKMLQTVQSGLVSNRDMTSFNVTASDAGNSMLSPPGESGKHSNSMLTPAEPDSERGGDAREMSSKTPTPAKTTTTTATTTTEKPPSAAEVVKTPEKDGGGDSLPPKVEDENDLSQAKKNGSKTAELDKIQSSQKFTEDHEEMMQGDDPNAYLPQSAPDALDVKNDLEVMLINKNAKSVYVETDSYAYDYRRSVPGDVGIEARFGLSSIKGQNIESSLNGARIELITPDGTPHLLAENALSSEHCTVSGDKATCTFNVNIGNAERVGPWELKVTHNGNEAHQLPGIERYSVTIPTHNRETDTDGSITLTNNNRHYQESNKYIYSVYHAQEGVLEASVKVHGGDITNLKLQLRSPDGTVIPLLTPDSDPSSYSFSTIGKETVVTVRTKLASEQSVGVWYFEAVNISGENQDMVMDQYQLSFDSQE